jgi:hypothetical protein
MKLFIEEEVVEEIKPIEDISEDKGLVITPTVGKRGENNTDIQKEIAAIDAIDLGASASAIINGVPQSSASKYGDGKDIKDADVRARIISKKYDIQDTAVSKLMETLNIIEPSELQKTRDKVMVLNGLSNLVDKITDKNGQTGQGSVHLHLYAPNQKKETDYKVIDV